jgi:pilus assembly protein TadC
MLQFIAGVGLFYLVATVILLVFVCVGIFETGLSEKMSNRDIAVSILQFLGGILAVTLIAGLVGWLIMQPLWAIFKCTCG